MRRARDGILFGHSPIHLNSFIATTEEKTFVSSRKRSAVY
jgi:hypothetical protein